MTFSSIFAQLVFGSVGFVALIYGKKQASVKAMVIGAALMGYTYFVTNTIALYGIGVLLTAALFFWRD